MQLWRKKLLLASIKISSHRPVQFSSVAQSCPTLCDPMNRSMPGLPVHHQLPKSTQTHCDSQLSSVQFSRSVVSDSLQLHEPQHARPPCPSSTLSPPKPMSVESVMPSNHLILCRHLLLLPSNFLKSGCFQMRQFFASDGQSTGVSASTSVLPMNTQD